MGCATSKIETEEVLLCKTRKHHIKQASCHRHTFASSHAAYVSSLKNTGAAISQFAEIEPPPPPSSSVLPHDQASSSKANPGLSTSSTLNHVRAPPQPPPYLDEGKPLPRSSSMPPMSSSSTSKRNNDENEEDGSDDEDSNDDGFGDDVDYDDEDDGSERGNDDPSLQNQQTSYRSLGPVLIEMDKHFLKSYEAGHKVSCNYLDAHRDFFHTPFVNERSGIEEHRRQVSRIISWTKSPKEPLVDGQNNIDNLASTLDKLHAWEKKLYDETKALASTTLELTRRKKQLESQEERGLVAKIDKTKNIVKGLETKYFVEYQAITEAQSEVCKLRDHRLLPQLKKLLGEMKKMWIDMYDAHKRQNLLIPELLNLKTDTVLNIKERVKFCERLTKDLEREIELLHNNLETMVKSQKEWMESMVEWLRRQHENDILGASNAVAPLLELCRGWGGMLKELPTEKVLVELKVFGEILHEMGIKQQCEAEAQSKIDELQRDLEKKKRGLELYEISYLEKNRQGNVVPHENRDPLQERKAGVELLEKDLRAAKERHKKLCEENSVMMLGCLQKGLPGVQVAMTAFAEKCMTTFDALCSTSQA